MIRYTDEQIAFLKHRYPVMSIAELAAAYNREFGGDKTETAIKCAMTNRKIRSNRPLGNPPGTLRSYTSEQAQFIREGYRTMTVTELTAAFNARFGTSKTTGMIRAFTRNHGIQSGRTGRFEKGIQPWNKGRKGYMGPNITSFKKGHVPPNRKPLGTERICSKDGYVLIKIAEEDPYTGFPTRYKLKHKIVWERHHGPIPAGMVVIFLDRNKMNCHIRNLAMVTRSELLHLNQHNYRNALDEIKPSIMALAKLEAKAGISTSPSRGRRRK